jgi:hypothetical protein
MTSGAQRLRKSFVEVGWGFLSVLLGFRALRWRVPEMVLGIDVPCDALLGAKPSHVGADVDGLAYSLHCPTTYKSQWGG